MSEAKAFLSDGDMLRGIIVGSPNINRMRGEIDTVVHAVTGSIPEEVGRKFTKTNGEGYGATPEPVWLSSLDGRVTWLLYAWGGPDSYGKSLFLSCCEGGVTHEIVTRRNGDTNEPRFGRPLLRVRKCYYNKPDENEYKLGVVDVPLVHANLVTLIGLVRRAAPAAEKHWAPLIAAAQL